VRDPLFRPARRASTWWNVTKTLLELLFLWFVFLLALPIGISIIEIEMGLQRFPGQPVPAATALGFFSAIGLWAALSLAIAGRGTPVPMDEARRFVVAGPYAHVRNPLAISAVGQGAAIGTALGSLPVLLYVVIGAVWWYSFMRPREEQHLAQKYGEKWKRYRREVRALVPRLTPYRPG
jgi:protein-S-isoprenylcysteine O-methyltransferase Ste14